VKKHTHDPISTGQSLDAVPTCNRAVRVERRGDTLILWVPTQRRWWMSGPLGWFLPFRREKGIELDALGQQVWQACDGERRIEQIIEDFAAEHRVRFHEARLSVMQFLRALMQRNLIALVVPETGEGSLGGGGHP
jgi:hypothetical protein